MVRENTYIGYLKGLAGDEQNVDTRIHIALGSGLAPDYSDWRNRGKLYYMLFGREVVLPIDYQKQNEV